MPRWLPKIIARICELAAARRVAFTLKSRWELAALGDLDEEDACDILAKLSVDDFAERLESKATGEWMYVFKPLLGETVLYVKIILRNDCVVISFHEDEGDGHEEDR
jgi:hypothetical protein